MLSRPGQILRGHADECAGEIGLAGRGALVRKNAGIELLRQPAPVVVRAFRAIREVEPFVIHFDSQMHRPAWGIGMDGVKASACSASGAQDITRRYFPTVSSRER